MTLERTEVRTKPRGVAMRRMQRMGAGLAALAGGLTWWLGTTVWAAGGKPATKLVAVADTRTLEPGLSKFFADVYNDDLVLFGLLVVVTMAGMGAVLGFFFDKIVGLLGINLGKLDHHE